MITSAMVLAAGRGERMRPLTDTIPKPLVAVAGKPIIDWQLDLLAEGGIQTSVVNVSYLGHLLEAHLAARTSPRILISREEVALETGGGIRQALPMLGDDAFFVLNGDVIVRSRQKNPITVLKEHWNPQEMDALLLLQPREQASGYEGKGDFFLDGADRLRRRQEALTAPYVFSGIQIVHPRLFEYAPEGKFSINVLYNQGMKNDGTLTRVKGIAHDGAWYHVGDVASIRRTEELLSAVRLLAHPDG